MLKILNLMKIRQVLAGIFHANRLVQTEVTKLVVAFRKFTNSPSKSYVLTKECTYAFSMDLRTNSNYFCIQQ